VDEKRVRGGAGGLFERRGRKESECWLWRAGVLR
jgi:hypothetical protein